MSQAIVDPAELRRFVQHLKDFSGEMIDANQTSQRQLAGWVPPGAIKSITVWSKNLNSKCAR